MSARSLVSIAKSNGQIVARAQSAAIGIERNGLTKVFHCFGSAPLLVQDRTKAVVDLTNESRRLATLDTGRRFERTFELEERFSAEQTFSTLMGTDVEARRTFIQQNAKDVRFLDA